MKNLRTKERIIEFDNLGLRDPQENLELSRERRHVFEDHADYSTSRFLKLT